MPGTRDAEKNRKAPWQRKACAHGEHGVHVGILQGRDLPASAQVGTYVCLSILGDSEDLAKLAIGLTLHSTFLVCNAIRLRISVTLTLRHNRPQHRRIAAQHLLLQRTGDPLYPAVIQDEDC